MQDKEWGLIVCAPVNGVGGPESDDAREEENRRLRVGRAPCACRGVRVGCMVPAHTATARIPGGPPSDRVPPRRAGPDGAPSSRSSLSADLCCVGRLDGAHLGGSEWAQ